MLHAELINTLPQFIASSIDVHLPTDVRSTTSAALADIGLEHYRSISKLIKAKHFGSASALMRPLFEAAVVSIWVYSSATDSELERLLEGKQLLSRTNQKQGRKGKQPKNFDEYVKELQNIPEIQVQIIQLNKDATWKALNSFTHGGIHAISRRFKDDKIRSNYPPETVEEIAKFCNQYAVYIFAQIASISKEESLIEPVQTAYGMLSEASKY